MDENEIASMLTARDGPEMEHRGSMESLRMVVSSQLAMSCGFEKLRALEVTDHVGLIKGERKPMELTCPCGNAFKPDSVFCRRYGGRRKSTAEASSVAEIMTISASLKVKTEKELEDLVLMSSAAAEVKNGVTKMANRVKWKSASQRALQVNEPERQGIK